MYTYAFNYVFRSYVSQLMCSLIKLLCIFSYACVPTKILPEEVE